MTLARYVGLCPLPTSSTLSDLLIRKSCRSIGFRSFMICCICLYYFYLFDGVNGTYVPDVRNLSILFLFAIRWRMTGMNIAIAVANMNIRISELTPSRFNIIRPPEVPKP